MKKEYTTDELNNLIENSNNFLILIRDKKGKFHYVSSKENWLCDGELLSKAASVVAQRLEESQN